MSVDDLLDVDIAAAADVKVESNTQLSSPLPAAVGVDTPRPNVSGAKGSRQQPVIASAPVQDMHVSVLGWPFHCAPATKEP